MNPRPSLRAPQGRRGRGRRTVAIGAALIAAGTAPTAIAADDLAIPFEKYELENGLDVILAEDHSIPIVHVNVWYHVGSKDERAGLTGFAHLFEHLMFQGSVSVPGEYFQPIEEVGGSLNGTTSFDRTNYFETVPSEYLPLALFMESDRMGWLLPVLDQTKLDNQREVVRNERRQRYENPPYGEAYKDLYAAVWPEGHPYHHMPIGSHEDLQNASLDDVKSFFQTWYSPDNASLVIAGDFDPAQAKELVQKYFGGIPKGPERARPEVPPATITEKEVVRQYDEVPEQKVWIAWISPALYAPGDAELDLFSSEFGGGKESRLYYRLVKEKQIAKDIQAYQASHKLGSMYVVSATAAKGHTTDEVVAEMDAVIAEILGDKPLTAEDLEAARAQYEVGFYHRLETISAKADALNSYNYLAGDPDYLQEDLQRYLDADVDEVLAAARETLQKPRVELHIWPEKDRPPGSEEAKGTNGATKEAN